MFIFHHCLCVYSILPVSYTCAMDLHFKFIEVEPVLGLLWVQVMIKISSCKPKTVEPQIRRQQQTRRALLIGHSGVAALPAPAWIQERIC